MADCCTIHALDLHCIGHRPRPSPCCPVSGPIHTLYAAAASLRYRYRPVYLGPPMHKLAAETTAPPSKSQGAALFEIISRTSPLAQRTAHPYAAGTFCSRNRLSAVRHSTMQKMNATIDVSDAKMAAVRNHSGLVN